MNVCIVVSVFDHFYYESFSFPFLQKKSFIEKENRKQLDEDDLHSRQNYLVEGGREEGRKETSNQKKRGTDEGRKTRRGEQEARKESKKIMREFGKIQSQGNRKRGKTEKGDEET